MRMLVTSQFLVRLLETLQLLLKNAITLCLPLILLATLWLLISVSETLWLKLAELLQPMLTGLFLLYDHSSSLHCLMHCWNR